MPAFSKDKRPLSTKVIHNAASGVLRILFVAPVPFVLTPLILHKVGSKGYGTWAVLVAVSNLTSLADLGLLGTLSKYVSEYHSKTDSEGLDRLLGTGLAVFGLLGMSAAFVLWGISSHVIGFLFRGSAAEPVELIALFHCLAVLVGLNILAFPFSSVTSGLQRLDLTNLLNSINVFLGALLGGGFLLLGWGVKGLILGNICSAGMTLLLYAVFVQRLLPGVKLNPMHADFTEAKKIFRFSLQLYVTQAAVAIHNQIEKLLLALFAGVAAAGWYDIASDIAVKVRNVPGLLLGPILPAASELNARGDQARLEELYFRAHKYLAFVSVPLVFYAIAVSRRFVELWIGPNLEVVATPFAILLCVNLVNLTTGPGFMIFAGEGFLRPGMCSAFVGICLNIPLSFALIYMYGFSGAVVGTSISLVAASTFFLYLFHLHKRYSVTRLLREAYAKPVLYSIALLSLGFVLHPMQGASWLGLFIGGAIFAVLYVTALLFSSFFDQYDWMKAESLIPVTRLAKRFVPVA
jgi:O-antigen/teichoic acid export membrane protein